MLLISIKNIHRKRLDEHFLQQIQQKRIRPVERSTVSDMGMPPQRW